jgi:hypothetical protein
LGYPLLCGTPPALPCGTTPPALPCAAAPPAPLVTPPGEVTVAVVPVGGVLTGALDDTLVLVGAVVVGVLVGVFDGVVAVGLDDGAALVLLDDTLVLGEGVDRVVVPGVGVPVERLLR